MGTLAFGVDEKLHCIADVELKGPDDEALCLGYKTSVRMVGGPIWVSDDGYILAVKSGMSRYFDPPAGEELAQMQQAGLMPDPLPPYSLSTADYFFGTITWWILGVCAIFGLISYWRGGARRTFLAADVSPSTDPPSLSTESDRWLRDEIMNQVEPGDDVMHQAYAFTSDPSQSGVVSAAKRKARYVGLTRSSLVVIEARVGALKPLLENHGTEVIPRDRIAGAEGHGDALFFHLDDGRVLELWPDPKQKHFTNQWRFTRDVPRLLAVRQPVGEAAAA